MPGSPIDANAFLDQETFATLLGVGGDDWIDLPAGFVERALTQLHAKGYGLLARRAEKYDDRYVRRLRQNAWNFDYFDTVGDPRAELGLRERPTPLGKLYIPAKSVRIGTGGAVAAPTVGRHGVGSATAWERLHDLTAAAVDTKRNKAVRAVVAQLTAPRVAIEDRIKMAVEIANKADLKPQKASGDEDNWSTLEMVEGKSNAPSPIPLMSFAHVTGGPAGDWYMLMARMPLLSFDDLNILSTYTDAVQMIFHQLGNPSEWTLESREVDHEKGEAVAVNFTFDTGLGVSANINVAQSDDDPVRYVIHASLSYIGDHGIRDLYDTGFEIGKVNSLDDATVEKITAILADVGPEMDVTEARLENVADYAELMSNGAKKRVDPFYRLVNDIIKENDIAADVLLAKIGELTAVDYSYMVDVPEEPKPPKKR